MKDNNSIIQLGVTAMIAIIVIMATYMIVDNKTSNISEQVANKMLSIEYEKVGGIENYSKITEITKKQVIDGLKQYDNQGGAQQPSAQPQANNAPAPTPTGSTISLDEVKQIIGEDDYILGNPDAEITWVEYSDLECPFCKKLHQAGTIDEVIKAYDGKVNFVFKQFPLGFHKNAPKEAEGALCAGELGGNEKYYSYINTIFERTRGNGTGFALSALVPLAVELGIDESKFKTCLDSDKYAARVQSDMSEGSGKFGITGTPGNVLINNKTGKWDKLPGAYPTASFKQKIDSLLQ